MPSSPYQKLVIDIETAGVDFETLDEISKDQLTKYFERYAKDDDEVKDQQDKLGFFPLTGYIVAIGILNPETNKGAIYLNSDGPSNAKKAPAEIAPGIALEWGSETDILKKFWNTALKYNYFITFNGRGFDAPFLMIRSAINGIRPSKNLMTNRYVSSQSFQALHIDLMDQLGFYGATRKSFSLHFWTKAFGIESPKEGEVDGDDVKKLFEEGEILKIAKYNAGDLFATKALYEKWDQFLNF